jgi:D-ribose pyranase
MKEIGLVNYELSDVITRLGHRDELLVCDAGYAIPSGIRVVDLSLAKDKPTVNELLQELHKFFSVEKLIFADETKAVSPSKFNAIVALFDEQTTVQTMPLAEFQSKSRMVKAAVRTGDFTAYSNVILVSGAGDRWYVEQHS